MSLFENPTEQFGTDFIIGNTHGATSLLSEYISQIHAHTLGGQLQDMVFVSTSSATTHGAIAQPFTDPPSFDTKTSGQWHLNNTGGGIDLNVASAWQDYTGKGIKVAVVDVGVQSSNSELSKTYNAGIDYNVLTGGADGRNLNGSEWHGTAVAGVIGAANNGVGTTGVAYDATLTSFKILTEPVGSPISSTELITCYQKQGLTVDISNNSWGWTTPFSGNAMYAAGVEAALQTVEGSSRHGLGTVFVYAAGNSRVEGDNANYSEMLNSRFVIAVAAADSDGNIASFSTPGAPILVTGAGVGVYTTDLTGTSGASSGNYATVNGTSFACPSVSGVVALMLQANSALGYRDVQEILAYSARQTDDSNATWETNDALNWNGGGMHTSTDYGFGFVDASAAVRLSETWLLAQSAEKLSNETTVTGASGTVNLAVNDNNHVTSTINIASAIDIQHVEVQLNMTHTMTGDLVITLTAPDGTSSVLFDRPINGTDTDDFDSTWSFSSTQFWGEHGVGTWTIRVDDMASGNTGTLSDWSLALYGDATSTNNNYVYTDEFSDYSGDSSRTTLIDSGGTDTLNAAAVSSNSTIDLAAGATSTIDGVTLTIDASSTIENAYTGDGDDSLTGNAVNNILWGGHGEDTLSGLGGNDTLWGGADNDTLDGGAGDDVMKGGKGDDIYIVDSALDVVTENVGEGTDTVQADMTFSIASYANVENLELTGHSNIDGTGNTLNNIITGNDGNNVLNGGAGNDTLIGGGGVDSFVGGAGNDTYIFSSASDSFTQDTGGIDTVQVDFSISITGNTALLSFENVILTGSGDINATGNDLVNSLTGNDGANNLVGAGGNDTLVGNDGADTLDGGIGNDTLNGGAGVDSMTGGAGNDTYYVDDNNDVVFESLGGGTDTVMSTISYTLTNEENLTLLGTDDIDATGSATNNIIKGNAGDNSIDGGLGSDTMTGYGGDDTYAVNTTGDKIIEAVDGGTDSVQSTATYTLAANVENLTLIGFLSINGTGNTLNNELVGNSGNNLLTGSSGNDSMTGGGGNDTFVDTAGNETYQTFDANFGDDIIRDMAGTDTLDLSNYASTDATFTALDGIDTGTNLDTLRIDFVDGSSITIEKFFSNTSLNVDTSSTGAGYMEHILFSGGTDIHLADIQALI